MRLKKIKKIRVAFLIIILAMILLETIMDTICVYKQQAHLTLYSFDLFLYLLIIYVEALQIDYIVQLLKKQKQPHIRGNLKIYEVLVSLSILFLLNHITFQCYYMYENGTVKECYYFSQEGESKFLIFLSTLIIELLILIDLLIQLKQWQYFYSLDLSVQNYKKGKEEKFNLLNGMGSIP